MKKNICFCLAAALLLTGCEKASDNKTVEENTVALREEINAQIDLSKIYFFYSNTCPHCHEALKYLDKKYPDLEITMVNIAAPDGYKLLVECARKFNLGNMLGTPLFCMGDQHLMGWAPEYEAEFDAMVRNFQNKTATVRH